MVLRRRRSHSVWSLCTEEGWPVYLVGYCRVTECDFCSQVLKTSLEYSPREMPAAVLGGCLRGARPPARLQH